MNISSLREFIISVPICSETSSLASIWQQFQQLGVDQLVVVDQQQMPLGLLKLSRLVTELLLVQVSSVQFSSLLPERESQPAMHIDLIALMETGLIEPVTLLSIESKFESPLADLTQQLINQEIVLVDAEGKYVGLLDRLRVLLVLTANQHPLKPVSSASPAFLDPLIDLIERLPLPLMLQTAAGRVITQNLTWRQRVGAMQHPQQIRQSAARILEATLSCQTNVNPSPVELRTRTQTSLRELEQTPASPDHPQLPDSLSAAMQGSCQLGTEPNACVCVCRMKQGQDRVWQFIKVPMGQSTAISTWNSFTPSESTEPLSPFKLASLNFSPDPNWRDLMQTETLWLIVAQDVTEQQQVAKELAAKNADLIQLNRLKDEFLDCISHELKTPLTAVLGMSSLLKDQLLGNLNERQAHYAQLIYRSGRHLVAIVNNILDLTRIETGQLELLLEDVHIPSLCQQAYDQAQQQLLIETNAAPTTPLQSELRFQLQVQPELQEVVADELRLRQMLVNLLSNAIKFTEPDGEIGLQVEAWEGWIAFTVWDTGIGIPAEKQHLIFQKFQQLEQPLTRQFHGTGLGLVLTQRLARLHGGDISFTSVTGQGSRFTLLLPPAPPQVSPADLVDRPDHPANCNRLVLLVEADPERLEQRFDQLTQIGHRVIVARSGTEAVEKARRLQPTVILLNPLLPLLSGWDVLTLLKADQTTRSIPIVVTALRVEKDAAYHNGAEAFLSLPISTEALQRCLERFIQPTQPEARPVSDLTVLHLHDGTPSLTLVSSQHHCRVLEVDDLEQADLLAKVWHPDVVLIDQIRTDPHTFMRQLSQSSSLSNLPLITLSTELTQAANQISELTVFPYLSGETTPVTELMRTMQIAVGVSRVPRILIVDCAAITFAQQAAPSITCPPVRALVQYMQTAGFHCAIDTDWVSIQQQLQHQGVDLLLLCVSFTESAATVTEIINALQQLPQLPILVWNYQPSAAVSPAAAAQWRPVATEILPAESILELLSHINRTLAGRYSA